MVKPEVIRKRIASLEEYLEILRGLQKYSLEEFLSNPEHYGSAERFLQLAIETTTDIGNHIISSLKLGEVNWYSDIAVLLEEKWIRIIGFRNILVHDYLEVDRKIVYQVLQNGLVNLEELKKSFAEFL
ncbi:MAG: type VII toxin-antitoxin system HepT family RNase toxin [Anaerolineales bacterium]